MINLGLRLKQCFVLSKYSFAKLSSYFFNKQSKYRNLWFICERGTDARDNAYFFYIYLTKYHTDINVIYCISKDSEDYSKFTKRDNIVNFGSFKHIILLNLAKYIISTHNCGHLYERNIFSNKFREKYVNNFKAKIVFLQHGITKDYLFDLVYPNAQFDLFICGAKPEYNYISNTFNHANGVVKYTGFARFDNLHKLELKKQILLMPTWRLYLNNISDKDFAESLYYRTFNRLLNNYDLISLLKDNEYELVFYPHYEVQKYIHLFNTTSKLVKIAEFKNFDVQCLLKESSLLLTDYSSVFFDFAYMHKPIIYYQFDKIDFFSKHYLKGYYNYQTMGFGKVVDNEQELINSIKSILRNQCKLHPFYNNRVGDFFELYDESNSKRIYEEIVRL